MPEWGGARKGAGRRPVLTEGITQSFVIEKKHLEFLEKLSTRFETSVSDALRIVLECRHTEALKVMSLEDRFYQMKEFQKDLILQMHAFASMEEEDHQERNAAEFVLKQMIMDLMNVSVEYGKAIISDVNKFDAELKLL